MHKFPFKQLLFLAIFFISVSKTTFAQNDIIKVGDIMPSFTLTNADGTTLQSSSFKGKAVLINFFATWCPPCVKEMPVIESDVWKKYKDNKNFILIAIGRGHSLSEISLFKEKTGYTFNMFPDSDKSIFNLFAKASIPRNYLIDKNGKVVYKSIGYDEAEFAVMKKLLATLLGQ